MNQLGRDEWQFIHQHFLTELRTDAEKVCSQLSTKIKGIPQKKKQRFDEEKSPRNQPIPEEQEK